ncbi:MAG: glycosyltransferase family 4 protein [Cypionkella sp.]|uniref:glycosyltransferase n=1 Tax=Cypionkella sp. TaxID=2811411 RepID=UPI0026026F12|nr:glycosyltransferase [Cypionkella sp.]MDB5661601.1 glycosyltransferase family 4 protein [Cypionkella sp.]
MTRIVHVFAGATARGIGLEAAFDIAAAIGPTVKLVQAKSWLSGLSEQIDHDFLRFDLRDDRLACMAEVLRRDYGRRAEPLLVLPSLAPDTADETWLSILIGLAGEGDDRINYRIWSISTGLPNTIGLPNALVAALNARGVTAETGEIVPVAGSALATHLALGPIINPADQPARFQFPKAELWVPRYPARKLLFIIDRLANRSGGAERVLIETAKALANRGHTVEIVSHEFRRGRPFYQTAAGVVHSNIRPPRRGLRILTGRLRNLFERHAPDWPLLDRLIWLSRNGGFWRRLQRYIETTRPDVAIAFMPPAMTALGMVRTQHPMRRVASTHNVPEQDFCNPERWDPSRLDRRRRLAMLAKMDRIAVLLPEFREFFSGSLRARVLLMPNAVAQVDSGQLAKAQRKPIVMSVGRLAPVKRHELLIEAWAQVTADFPKWELQIYGDGPLRPQLEDRIKELALGTVMLMGHQQDVAERYRKAMILAHPAEFEGFGLAPAEAMVSAVPVIGFADCSGVNTLVTHGVNGLLVAAEGDRVSNFAEALRSLMKNENLRLELAQAGPPSMAIYAPDAVVDLWEDMLFADAVPRGGLAG